MAEVSNNESFDPQSSATRVPNLQGIFKREMDTLLRAGREIVIDLPPSRTNCPASCRYNPTYKKYQGSTGAICQECKGQGFLMDPRFTRYRCNRRWTNEAYDKALNTGQETTGGRIVGNFVRVKTVIDSFDHIERSIGATIDGVKVKLYKEPRKTGFGDQLYYVISWWERMGK
jgi:hypothetical protein